ncbi:hypothetical protein LTR27_010899 [Elasticomyces elasticus]|nr:hypothetical protein LTR27_010899 [Elasticomyces elasticus]
MKSTSTILLNAAAHAGIPGLSRSHVEEFLLLPAEIASIAMILPFTPMLQLLSFTLPQLSEVRAFSQRGENAFDRLIDVLMLPALRTLRARKFSCEVDSTDALAILSASLGVKRIYFEESCADATGIGRLLAAAPGLKPLSVDWGSQGTHLLEFGTLGQALCAHGKNLESLYLTSENLDTLLPNPGMRSPIGNLRGLEFLQHLALPHAVLCTSENADEFIERSRDYLVKVLPHLLRSLAIEEAEPTQRLENAQREGAVVRNTLDLQLLGLMEAHHFADLALITVHRNDGFTCLEDAQALDWSEERTNDAFMLLSGFMLRRRSGTSS